MLIFAKAARATLLTLVVAASGCFAGHDDGRDYDDVSTDRGGVVTAVGPRDDVVVDDGRDVVPDDQVVVDDDADFVECQNDCDDDYDDCIADCRDSVCDAICDDDARACLADCE